MKLSKDVKVVIDNKTHIGQIVTYEKPKGGDNSKSTLKLLHIVAEFEDEEISHETMEIDPFKPFDKDNFNEIVENFEETLNCHIKNEKQKRTLQSELIGMGFTPY